MKKTITLAILVLLIGINLLNAQTATTSIQNPVDKLSFMIGEWEGSGWMMTREGKQTSIIKEKVECKLDCNILTVEGLGTKTDSVSQETVVVHDAFGVIFFDPQSNSLSIRAYKKEGVTESEIEFIEEKIIQWNLDIPDGSKVRFTVDFKTDDKWIEIGEFSRDGENWTKILGMELTKAE